MGLLCRLFFHHTILRLLATIWKYLLRILEERRSEYALTCVLLHGSTVFSCEQHETIARSVEYSALHNLGVEIDTLRLHGGPCALTVNTGPSHGPEPCTASPSMVPEYPSMTDMSATTRRELRDLMISCAISSRPLRPRTAPKTSETPHNDSLVQTLR